MIRAEPFFSDRQRAAEQQFGFQRSSGVRVYNREIVCRIRHPQVVQSVFFGLLEGGSKQPLRISQSPFVQCLQAALAPRIPEGILSGGQTWPCERGEDYERHPFP